MCRKQVQQIPAYPHDPVSAADFGCSPESRTYIHRSGGLCLYVCTEKSYFSSKFSGLNLIWDLFISHSIHVFQDDESAKRGYFMFQTSTLFAVNIGTHLRYAKLSN